MASALSSVTLRTPSHPTPSAAYPSHNSSTFPCHSIEFPLKSAPTHLRRRAPALRSLATLEAPEKVVELGNQISLLTLVGAQKLVENLQDKLGVSAAPFAMAAVAAAPTAASVVEEKTEFDMVIEDVLRTSRIATIKVVWALTSLPLKEAKELIKGLPKKFKETCRRRRQRR